MNDQSSFPFPVYETNDSRTVALVEMTNPKENFVACVNPLLLKQWAEMVFEQYGNEDVVYISIHKHPDPMCTVRHMAAASEYGDDLQVLLCGTDCDDVLKRGVRP